MLHGVCVWSRSTSGTAWATRPFNRRSTHTRRRNAAGGTANSGPGRAMTTCDAVTVDDDATDASTLSISRTSSSSRPRGHRSGSWLATASCTVAWRWRVSHASKPAACTADHRARTPASAWPSASSGVASAATAKLQKARKDRPAASSSSSSPPAAAAGTTPGSAAAARVYSSPRHTPSRSASNWSNTPRRAVAPATLRAAGAGASDAWRSSPPPSRSSAAAAPSPSPSPSLAALTREPAGLCAARARSVGNSMAAGSLRSMRRMKAGTTDACSAASGLGGDVDAQCVHRQARAVKGTSTSGMV